MTITSEAKGQRGKMKYSFEMMLNDIQDIPDENESNGVLGDKVGREFEAKRIVIQMLVNLAFKYSANIYNEKEKLRKALERAVNEDELLSGYAFFVPQNPQFDYTWSYMRKREKSYIEFLVRAIIFLKNVLFDINILASKSWEVGNLHFVVNDIFDVALIAAKPHVKTRLLWENLYRIVAVQENYNVVAMVGDVVWVVRDRKDVSDVDNIIDAVLQMINNNERNY